MKDYLFPEIEIIRVDMYDILTMSNGYGTNPNENEFDFESFFNN